MTTDMRDSEIVAAVQATLERPALGATRSSQSSVRTRRPAMDGMVLSFDETQRLRQVVQRSQAQSPRTFTAERPTAIEPPSRWHRVWHGMCCASAAPSTLPAPQAPAHASGGWVVCNPPVPIGSLDGVRSGYQVRTTQGMDMIYGVALPTANDASEMVTMYRDLAALADAQP